MDNLPTNLNDRQIELVKRTVAVGATNDELALFLHTAQRTGLDPLAKQIHFIKRKRYNKDKDAWEEVGSIQTGIDGYRLIADRTYRYAPGDIVIEGTPPDMTATATVKKEVGGTWHEIRATAYWPEYCQTTRDGKPMGLWAKMPRLMLGKCAEALALRRAFPAELSGVYTHEEMAQADSEPKFYEPRGTPIPPKVIQPPVTTPPPADENADDLDKALGTKPPPDLAAADKKAETSHKRSLVAMKLKSWMKDCGVEGDNAEKMRHTWVETFYGVAGLRELSDHDISKLYKNLVLAETPKAQEYVEKVRAWIKLQAHLFGGKDV